jgi:anti-sigma regulatory factor (Ser/Thr protein kinase)
MRHSLFVYEDDDRLVRKVAPFLESGLRRGDPAIVILERAKCERLAAALGSAAGAISFVDRDAFYTRPEAALAGYDGRVRRLVRDGAQAIRVFAELPGCETDAQWNPWIRYEAIVNRALVHHPLWVMCGYDAREVPESVLDGAFETHPEVLADDWARNSHYHAPEEFVRARTPTPAAITGLLHPLPVDGDSRRFREGLSAELEAAEVSEPDAENMVIAAAEVLANARRHGGAGVSVNVGRVEGRFVCEVSDDGPGIDDPLTGFLPPRPGHAGGAGLWVARQLTRELELVRAPHGQTVRLWT